VFVPTRPYRIPSDAAALRDTAQARRARDSCWPCTVLPGGRVSRPLPLLERVWRGPIGTLEGMAAGVGDARWGLCHLHIAGGPCRRVLSPCAAGGRSPSTRWSHRIARLSRHRQTKARSGKAWLGSGAQPLGLAPAVRRCRRQRSAPDKLRPMPGFILFLSSSIHSGSSLAFCCRQLKYTTVTPGRACASIETKTLASPALSPRHLARKRCLRRLCLLFPHFRRHVGRNWPSTAPRLRNQSHQLVQRSHARPRPTWAGGKSKSRPSRTIGIDPCTSGKLFPPTCANHCRTFLKRKGGLFKKAHELSVLCSVDVAVIIFGHNKKLYEFSSGDINETLTRYSYVRNPPVHTR
jgi:hypothetical protein